MNIKCCKAMLNIFAPHPADILRHFWDHNTSGVGWGGEATTSIWWWEVKDAATHPTMHRAVPTRKGDLVQHVSSAEAETFCYKIWQVFSSMHKKCHCHHFCCHSSMQLIPYQSNECSFLLLLERKLTLAFWPVMQECYLEVQISMGKLHM